MSFLPLLFCIIAACVAGFSNRKSTDDIVCETNACRAIGESIQRSINKSVDPCINFYEYGCGLWPKNNPIPSNEAIWSTMSQIALKTHLRLKGILEESNEYDNLEPIQKMKQYYDSCMDEDAIEKQGLKPIQEILDANGGWPIQFGNQKISNYTWQEIDTNYMQELFEGTFLEFGFLPEEKDVTKTILVLTQFEKSFVNDENIVESKPILFPWEERKMTNVVRAFMKQKGIDIPPENFTADVTELLIFQQNLQNITQYENEINKGMKKKKDRMTIAELQKYYDEAGTRNPTAQIDWLHLIQTLFKPYNVTVNSSYPVLVYNKQLFHKLAHLLDVTPPHVIVNYVQWNMVNKFLSFLNKEMRDYLFETLQMKFNVAEREPRWISCVKDIPMKDALSFLFIKKYHSSHTIAAVTEMLNDLKAEIKEHILNSKWTNNNMKNFMTDKIDNIISLIGYPSWYNNETAMIERYEGLEFGENYFENKIVSLTYEIRKLVITSMDSTDRSKWQSSPLTMNAFYDPTRNLMIIPVAEIQDPFFTPGMPLAVNYGAISMIIGHELAHSFDTIGIEYDKFGNKITKDAETAQAYEERVKCFIDQYNNYTVIAEGKGRKPVHSNGLFTKDENVADNIGLQIAFEAFQKRKQLAGPQPKLPGLTDISDEQLFFLSFANMWCTTMTEQIATILTDNDSHSLNRFRVLGVVSNMVSFSDTFNCPADSPLNRDSKCTLWK